MLTRLLCIVISFTCCVVGAETIRNNIQEDEIPTTTIITTKHETTKEITTVKETTTIETTTVKDVDENDLYLLAHLIMAEGGSTESNPEALLYGIGSVALNRVYHPNFPNTLKGVIYQKGQYACTWDGNFNKEPTERCWNIARELLETGPQFPRGVVYQAEFKQGDAVFCKIKNTYFCYEVEND